MNDTVYTASAMRSLIMSLDQVLTGKDLHTVEHTANNQIGHINRIAEGVDELYYLSDGGCSRIYFDPSRGVASLDSVSMLSVKECWVQPAARALRQSILDHWKEAGLCE